MGTDFEKLSLKELFTNAEAFIGFSLGILGGLVFLLILMLWGYAG